MGWSPLQHHHHTHISTQRIFYLRALLFSLAGAAMIGQAGRMIYQGVFQPQSVYIPNTVDLLFDWATLAILGLCLLCYTFYIILSRKTSASHVKQ